MELGLSLLVQGLAYQAGTEFESRLNQYYAMQSLRQALADIRQTSGRYLRETHSEPNAAMAAKLQDLAALARPIGALEAGEGEIAFRAIEVRRGLAEYLKRLRSSLDAYARQDSASYELYLSADHVAGYVDNYLGTLLSLSLADGTAWYQASASRTETWRRWALAINLLALGAAVSLAFVLASSIARPIRRLALASERLAAGDFDQDPVIATTRDEVEVLARSFATMSQNIREMVGGLQDKVALEQKLHDDELAIVGMDRDLKEARFAALQSRIRPHFLFNALNTLARSALLERASETELLARSLATLMRYSLGQGETMVTIGQELGILREYLAFQNIRFGSRLQWDILADPAALEAPIPRFSLQPLVENAVIHGIEPLVDGGRVRIAAQIRGKRIKLVVMDTGRGMDAAALARVRASIGGQVVNDPGVGTASLESRLAYRYQEGVRTAVHSRPGRGTLISIIIPREETES